MGIAVFVGLGSNMGLCSKNLQNAIALLSREEGIQVLAQSRVYRTEPQELRDQPWFYNQVVLIEVSDLWTPPGLLRCLQGIEKDLGRITTVDKGPRVIDLDILIFGDEIYQSNELIIPHPQMKKRAFVLIPMIDIEPEFIFPDGETIMSALGKLSFRVDGDMIYQGSDLNVRDIQ